MTMDDLESKNMQFPRLKAMECRTELGSNAEEIGGGITGRATRVLTKPLNDPLYSFFPSNSLA